MRKYKGYTYHWTAIHAYFIYGIAHVIIGAIEYTDCISAEG